MFTHKYLKFFPLLIHTVGMLPSIAPVTDSIYIPPLKNTIAVERLKTEDVSWVENELLEYIPAISSNPESSINDYNRWTSITYTTDNSNAVLKHLETEETKP